MITWLRNLFYGKPVEVKVETPPVVEPTPEVKPKRKYTKKTTISKSKSTIKKKV